MKQPTFNLPLLWSDMQRQGINRKMLARRAAALGACSDMRVYHFFSGRSQTAPTGKLLAQALGFDVARYLRGPRHPAAAAPVRRGAPAVAASAAARSLRRSIPASSVSCPQSAKRTARAAVPSRDSKARR